MRSIVYIVMLFCLSISAIFCGCAEDASNGGKNEPMSFSAEICNRTQTRAAVDTSKHSGTNLIVHTAEPAKGITLSVSKMTRTSTADGYWPSGANLAIQQGGTVKQYTVDGSGNITSSSPFYWANKNDVSVTSWFPYSASLPTTWTVNSNQSTESNYNGSDLLYSAGTLSYDGSKELKYNHETAKVVINIVKANGLTSLSSIKSVTIGTSNSTIKLSGNVGGNGTITSTTTTTDFIAPYRQPLPSSESDVATYTALVIPQDMNGKQFIAVTVGSNTYFYKPTSSTILQGGYEFDYNVTIPVEYYFSDGTCGTLAENPSKTPIAVIFSSGIEGSAPYEAGYTNGLAIALTDADGGNYSYWASSSGVLQSNYNYSNPSNALKDMSSGYVGGIKNSYGKNSSDYAFYYCGAGYTVSAPSSSSGWYLPSIGEIIAMYEGLGLLSYNTSIASWNSYSMVSSSAYNEFQSYFTNAKTANATSTAPHSDCGYWASSEYTDNNACAFGYTKKYTVPIYVNSKSYYGNLYRSIIAF